MENGLDQPLTPSTAPRTQAISMIVEKEGRYLLGKRAEWKRTAAGHWCPISGKIEPGESEESACVREAMEEAGIEIRVIRKLGVLTTRNGRADLHWWHAELIQGEAFLANDENSAIGWFSIEELRSLEPTFEEDLNFIYQVEAELRTRLS